MNKNELFVALYNYQNGLSQLLMSQHIILRLASMKKVNLGCVVEKARESISKQVCSLNEERASK